MSQNKELSELIYKEKYLQEGETFKEGMARIAGALTDDKEHFYVFKEILEDQRFLPAGRIQVAVGSARVTTPYNCFVSGTIPDSMKGIANALSESLETLRLGGGIGYDFCLALGTKVLTADMDWVSVEDLSKGDKVVGFPEELNLQKNTYEESEVLSNEPLTQPSYLVETDRGNVECSASHLFVSKTKSNPKKKGEGYRWIATEDLKVGNQIAFTSEPWTKGNNHDTGWLSGILDGEGWATKTNVGVAQNEGPVLNKIRRLFDYYGISFRENTSHPCTQLICKGKWNALKLLGVTKPERLRFEWRGRKLCGGSQIPATIKRVTYLGERTVYATKTSTKTLIANGFCSHNSTLRPSGDRISTLDSTSCGPVGNSVGDNRGFMDLFDSGCAVIRSAGHRRGAQMGVLRVDHPDIRHFIRAKRQQGRLTNFNISVGITDKFMVAVKNDTEFELKFDGRVYEVVNARNLWQEIMRSTWDYAEPGVLFIDRINMKNNLWYEEEIAATNPCGEQPLPPYGACLLGSFNLTKYVYMEEGPWPVFDYEKFKRDVTHTVPAMDRVIDVAVYPLEQQKLEAQSKRRMGLGVTGLAHTAELIGYSYGSEGMLEFTKKVLTTLRDTAYLTSCRLAVERGSFELLDKERYLLSGFARSLPDHIRSTIRDVGIRNSHLLSVAPTGTISLAAGNVSSGIEPPYTTGKYKRKVTRANGETKEFLLEDWLEENYCVRPLSCDECNVNDHLAVLNLVSVLVDSSVSKTCNVGDDVTFEKFSDIYMKAYDGGASGCTTFREAGFRRGIMSKQEEDVGGACYIDPETGSKTCE